MKRRKWLRALVRTVVGVLIGRDVWAQAPMLTDAEFLLLQATQLLGATAQAECNKLEGMQRYLAQKQLVTNHFEREYPGFTVDWAQLPAQLQARHPR